MDDYMTSVKQGISFTFLLGRNMVLKHFLRFEFVEVQTGIGISDEDFTHLYFEWDDVINHFQESKGK